ncbi:MAG TPA: Rne/Rng family ribonuclease, partial [Methylomirabilota bacterium]|nr:Rne/Rng family ribonuclease [Methylomirabilota bacterium]
SKVLVMNEGKSFGGRRRRGKSFRPSGGLSPHPRKSDRAAQQARAIAIGEKSDAERIFENERYEKEIERAQNVAAGLPPEGEPQPEAASAEVDHKHDFREPHLDTPAEVKEETFQPVPIEEPPPQGLVAAIRAAATRVINKVQRLLKPKKRTHKEVIINAEALETRVAVLIEGRLDEFTIERTNEDRLVGSIFKGKVRNLEDGLKAAFVDIGFEKNAFLHYWDIVPSSLDSGVEAVDRNGGRRREKPRITQKDIPRLYPPGSDIIVQVTKGPIGSKGPRVTTNLVLPGRYLVLLPNAERSGISRKIENPEERARLKKILRSLTLPEGMEVIMRTVGEGQQARYFVRDLALLLEEWNLIQERIKTQPPATCVFQEPDLIERTVRDFLTEDVERIVVDSAPHYERMQQMIAKISKRSADKVKLYTDHQPIFDRFNITRQLETTFSRQVHLKSGGYLVIDETEALVAIDVNTGRHKGGKDQESTILKVNLEAAEEICRQLRLRNMGGLIVLDFIDMKSRRDQQLVYQKMKEGLRRDRAKTHILPISQLGLMEMTRQRHTESVRSAVYDECHYCKGKGVVKSALTMSVEIQRKLAEILKRRSRDESDFQLRIVVHPTVYQRMRSEDEKIITEMEKRYYGKIIFRPDPAIHAEHFKIYNALNNEELASSGH